MTLRHHRRWHGEQNAVRVYQAGPPIRLQHEGHRLTLHDRDPNLVRQQAHHRCFFYPGNLFQLPAALGQRDKENIAPNVFAEDRQHLRAAHLGETGSLDVVCPGNVEARIATQEGVEKECAGGQPAHYGQRKNNAPCRLYPAPPGLAWPAKARFSLQGQLIGVFALQRYAGQRAARKGHTLLLAPRDKLHGRFIAVRGFALQHHAVQRAPRRGHTPLMTPRERLLGRFILPCEGTSCINALSLHAEQCVRFASLHNSPAHMQYPLPPQGEPAMLRVRQKQETGASPTHLHS